MDLIDRDKLDSFKFRSASERIDLPVDYMVGWNDAIDHIEANAPRVYAEPVRHGKWWRYPLEQLGFPEHVYMMRQCSECKKVFDQKWNYCPNCGVKMDERKAE